MRVVEEAVFEIIKALFAAIDSSTGNRTGKWILCPNHLLTRRAIENGFVGKQLLVSSF